MKVYLCYQRGIWQEKIQLLGIFSKKQDAIDMCNYSNLSSEENIEEHEVIE